jgi:TPR repeat protein
MLGFTYATGWGRPQDIALGYQYYGLALIEGRTEARTNLDELWGRLDADNQQYIRFRFERAFPRP